MANLISLFGMLAILGLAWLASEKRWRVSARVVLSGLVLQFLIALVLLKTNVGQQVFRLAERGFARVLSFSDAGAQFVFGPSFKEHYVAFSVLPTIIFVSSMMAVLFHLGLMQWVIRGMAWLMKRVMDTSGTESLAAAAEVFVGMTESPLIIRPYLPTMTRSEIMAMMTAGLGTVAGGVLAAYAGMGVSPGHLMAASLMAAPASLVIAKIMVPETEESLTKGTVRIDVPKIDRNVIDAACRGASDGLQLALNVAAMLIAFIAIVACLNWGLGKIAPDVAGAPLSLERMLGWCCCPLAWLLGVPWDDAQAVGMLLGKKIVLNEFLAYQDLVALRENLSERAQIIATYALCGFANFGSVAVQIGGIGTLVPSQRPVFAQLGLKALLGGVLTTMLTAAIAGVLLS